MRIADVADLSPMMRVERLEDRTLLAAGELDPTFGNSGKVILTLGNPVINFTSVAVQTNGKIVAAGSYFDTQAHTSGFLVARFKKDGTLDKTFDGDGIVQTAFPNFDDSIGSPVSLALQSDGKIIVVGTAISSSSGTTNGDFALARYHVNGSLDESFDGDGKLTTDFGAHDTAFGVAIQSDGKIVVVGDTATITRADFALARYNRDGTLDASFDSDGKQTTNFGDSSIPEFGGSDDFARSVAVLSDGEIVVAGYTFNSRSTNGFSLARYTNDGQLNASFGRDGKVTTAFHSFEDRATDVAIQSDGKIVVVGSSFHAQTLNYELAVARYNADGTLDSSFGSDGRETTAFPVFALAKSVAVRSDGKINVAGDFGSSFGIVRYNANGTLDSSFGTGGSGLTQIDFGEENGSRGYGVAVQSDGNLVVAGYLQNGRHTDAALARFVGSSEILSLPAEDGTAQVFLIDGVVHLRRSRNSRDLTAPVAVTNLETLRIQGSGHSDRLTLDRSLDAFPGSILFNGGDGNDFLDARAVGLNVTFNGGAGNDTFLGGGGIDVANGGQGNDSLSGGTGDDSLLGGGGRDTINGDSGNDVIDGGEEDDLLFGSKGNDSLRGGNGNDTIYGGAGDDLLIGSAGNDFLFGESGTDTLLGDSGNDLIYGGIGNDVINPGSGRKTILDTIRIIDTSFTFDFDSLLAGIL